MFQMVDINKLDFDFNFGDRYEYNGKIVPRVTEIISKMIHEEGLMSWSNGLGFKKERYKDVLNAAAEYGTKVHHGIEVFLQENKILEETPCCPLQAFTNWYNSVRNANSVVEVVGQEEKLTCEWYGGTYDLLLKVNDKIWLIDFKTSNHITYKYYIQMAAYIMMLEEKGIKVDGCLILQLSKNNPTYREYVLDLSKEEHKNYMEVCKRTFLSLVYGYYHIKYLEGEFKNV